MITVRTGRGMLSTVLRLPRWILLGALRAYQLVISPMTGPTCRFYPSCSQYAVIAVREHGAVRGTGYAIWRVLRCNPLNLGGIDDVPGTEHRYI